MAKLTERENLQMVYDGLVPEWVPLSERCSAIGYGPPMVIQLRKNLTDTAPAPRDQVGAGSRLFDIFGIEYEISDPRIGPMPAPDVFKVPDITKWHEYFPPSLLPDLSSYDWNEIAKPVVDNWDRVNKRTKYLFTGCTGGTTYMWMATILGHKEAMIASLEEPEAWHELNDVLTSWQEEAIRYIARYIKPDSICFCDDNAYGHGTFLSPATYKEMIKPYHARLAKAIISEGCVAEIHCCGKADMIADDFVDIGLSAWNPAQHFNDLEGIQERHGNKLILEGGWESNGPAGIAGASEAIVRAAVRRAMDRSAKNGGYVFSTSGMTAVFDVGQEHVDWISDEAVKYGEAFYKK
ncbi:MAG: hypothetical protein FWG30_04330 [Eubacteriaceae bacterium]|nr:hypothetical protein [Eubacteriaceae bacterium]